jgi:heat shock protein HslJ
MTTRRSLTVLALLAVAGGCGEAHAAEPAADPLAGRYVVTDVTENGAAHELVPGTRITVEFDRHTVVLSAGCNTMSASYRLDGSRMTVGPLASTEMGCPDGRNQQDAWLAALFARPVQVAVGKEKAVISGTTVLAFGPREPVGVG